MPIMAVGTLVAFGMGAVTSWQYVAIFGATLPLILLPCVALISDSPYWYVQQGDEKKAVQVSLSFYFG